MTLNETIAPSEISENSFLEEYLYAYRRRAEDRIAMIGAVEDCAIVKHESDQRWMMILRDVSGADSWRTQSFDLFGFSGHGVYPSKELAIRAAAQSNFAVRQDGALDEIQDSPEFQYGLYVTEQIQLVNFGKITHSDYRDRLVNYRAINHMAML